MNDYGRDLLFLLHDVARLMRTEGDKRARQHGMTRAQWVILIWLDRWPGLSQKEVAELLEVEPITVARLVDRLEARGMVERRPDPNDRRVWRLHLLPPARRVLDEIAVHKVEMLDMAPPASTPRRSTGRDRRAGPDEREYLRRTARRREGDRLMSQATHRPRTRRGFPRRRRWPPGSRRAATASAAARACCARC